MYSAPAFRGKERRMSGGEPRGFPSIRLEMLEDLSPPSGQGFLKLVRRKLRAHYPDETSSAPFVYDEVDRRAIDAVVVAAHHVGPNGVRHVYLRSALRPPVYFRGTARAPVPVPDNQGGLWELPAGLVEADELSPEGLLRGAARELHEEAGLEVPPSALRALGPSMYPCPAVIAERHFFFEVEVDPAARVEPPLDGSALERFGKILDVPVGEALAMCARGEIEDAKTELLLRRLAERYP
jgi:ADP-ribose pyrophosphatase